MTSTTAGTLEVPGARLHYQVRGSGPVLLVLQGGTGSDRHTDALVDQLAGDYRVVTYDRRGLARSVIHEPFQSPSVEVHCDDARHVLAAVTTEPVLVVGFSIGALIGLHMITHFPDQVRMLFAHEPPALQLLPETLRAEAVHIHEDIVNACGSGGLAAAVPKMFAMVGLSPDAQASNASQPAPSAQEVADMEFFLANDLPAVLRYKPDVAALRAASARIVVLGGETSGEIPARQCSTALAHEVGVQVAEVPGGHAGFSTHPTVFGARLRELLGGPMPDRAS